MNIVVDTSVWSLVLRRKQVDEKDPHVVLFQGHVERGDCIHLVGNVLQELLDGVSTIPDFDRLIKLLTPFPLLSMNRETFILASRLRNDCRRRGVQASPADFLISACCIENGFPLLSSDQDFAWISKHSKLTLLPVD